MVNQGHTRQVVVTIHKEYNNKSYKRPTESFVDKATCGAGKEVRGDTAHILAT
jgi:hypothetical protein